MSVQGHTVASYDEELSAIADSIQSMSKAVIMRLDHIANSLSAEEPSLLAEAKKGNQSLYHEHLSLEEEAISILAKRQPVAMDLRFTVSAVKIAVALERVSDLTQKTASLLEETGQLPRTLRAEIVDMVFLVQKMLKNACKCFRKNEVSKIAKIFQREAKVDELTASIRENMMDILRDPKKMKSNDCVHVILATKNIERIGDYATHIASMVQYVSTGQYQPNA